MLASSVIGQGQPLILLHGLFGMGDNLSMVAKSLSEYFQVYRLDLRNHGRSPRADSMTLTEMAADVKAFMDAHGIVSTHLLGHSLGGKVAMQLALDYPEAVEKLVVADIAPVAYKGGHKDVFAGLEAVDLASLSSRRDAENILRQFIQQDNVRLFLLKNLYRDEGGKFQWRINLSVLSRCYESFGQANHGDHPFTGPVLFIKGELSDYITEAYSDATRRLFPNAQLKIIQNTGHWLHAEKPVIFNQLVKRFLTSPH
ncbi:MAG: alpha/beta fold hydrolase [Oceanicoccus sp.]